MNQFEQEFGSHNPKAPPALLQFAFLIGRWECEARLKDPQGDWKIYHAFWRGRFILQGYAIADEYSMSDPSGDLIVLGMNFRTYDTARQAWSIKWLNAFAGTWTDLVTEEFGGITITAQSISYAFKEPVAAQPYTRATYKNISPAHFTWQGEKSDDGSTWTDFMIVECHRREQ